MESLNRSQTAAPARWKPVFAWSIRGAVLLIVAAGIWRAAERARGDVARQNARVDQRIQQIDEQLGRLEAEPPGPQRNEQVQRLLAERRQVAGQRITWTSVSPVRLAAAGMIYLVASVPCWWFWHRTLRALGQAPTPCESARAYFIGHLGKYVPGKALVVILRTGLVRSARVSTQVAVISVFVETLTMMAVGAAVSAVLLSFAWQREEGRAWLPWAIALAVAAALPTAPPLFRRIVPHLQPRRYREHTAPLLDGLTLRFMLSGWLLMLVSWFGMGLSLWATTAALPGDFRPLAATLADLPTMTACIALAVVLGFASLIPGGFGVRELVVTSILAPLPSMGAARALGAAVLLRLVWLVAEVLVSIILYLSIRGPEPYGARPSDGTKAAAEPPLPFGAS